MGCGEIRTINLPLRQLFLLQQNKLKRDIKSLKTLKRQIKTIINPL